jgi:hypothetical protein
MSKFKQGDRVRFLRANIHGGDNAKGDMATFIGVHRDGFCLVKRDGVYSDRWLNPLTDELECYIVDGSDIELAITEELLN